MKPRVTPSPPIGLLTDLNWPMWRVLAKTGGAVIGGMLLWWGAVAASCSPNTVACVDTGWFSLRMNLYDSLFLLFALASLASLAVAIHRNTH